MTMAPTRATKMIHRSSERAARRRMERREQAVDPPEGDIYEEAEDPPAVGEEEEDSNEDLDTSSPLNESAISELSEPSMTTRITAVESSAPVVNTPERKKPTTEREVTFEEPPPSPEDGRKKKKKKRRGDERRGKPKRSRDLHGGDTDDDDSTEAWEDTLTDQVLDFLTPEEHYSDDEGTLPSIESREPPTILNYFFSHGRAKQDLFDEMQDKMFEKLGCCQPVDWDDFSDGEDDDSTIGGSTLEGGDKESIPDDILAAERKRKAAEKRAKIVAKRRAKRAAARAKREKEKKNAKKFKETPIAIAMSMDEESHGLEAMACFDYKKCSPNTCADENVLNDLLESDENDSLTEQDKIHIKKTKDENGKSVLSVFACDDQDVQKQTKKSFRASMQYLSSLLRLNRDPRVGGRKLVVKTIDEENEEKAVDASLDEGSWVDPLKLKPIAESPNEDNSTIGNTTVSDMNDTKSMETGSTHTRSMTPDPERGLYSEPLDAYNYEVPQDDKMADMFTKNFNKFREENFAGMDSTAIISEFSEFLKERGLNDDAKEQVLSQVKKALACHQAEEGAVLSFDENDNDMVETTAKPKTDPPVKPEDRDDMIDTSRKIDPPENPDEEDKLVGAGTNNDPPAPSHDPPAIDATMSDEVIRDSAIEILQDGDTVLAITTNVTADETHVENIVPPEPERNPEESEQEEEEEPEEEEEEEEQAPVEPDKSTVVMANKMEKKGSFRNKLQSRISSKSAGVENVKVQKEESKPTKQVNKKPVEKLAKKTPVEKPEKKVQASRKSKSRKPSIKRLTGLAKSFSFFGKSKKSKEKSTVMPMASHDTNIGAYTEDILSNTSSDDEVSVKDPAVEQANKVNIFEWATSDEKEAASSQSSPLETTSSSENVADIYSTPWDPNQSTKAKREAWRKKTSSERKEKDEPPQTPSEEMKRSPSTPLKEVQAVSSTRSLSALPKSSGDDVFDDLMSSPVEDGWADFSQLSAHQSSTGSPAGVDEFDSLMTPHAVTDDWDDIVSSISVKSSPNRMPRDATNQSDSPLQPTTPKSSNLPVIRRRLPSGTEDSFTLSPGKDHLPAFVKRHEGPPSHPSVAHVAQFDNRIHA